MELKKQLHEIWLNHTDRLQIDLDRNQMGFSTESLDFSRTFGMVLAISRSFPLARCITIAWKVRKALQDPIIATWVHFRRDSLDKRKHHSKREHNSMGNTKPNSKGSRSNTQTRTWVHEDKILKLHRNLRPFRRGRRWIFVCKSWISLTGLGLSKIVSIGSKIMILSWLFWPLLERISRQTLLFFTDIFELPRLSRQ